MPKSLERLLRVRSLQERLAEAGARAEAERLLRLERGAEEAAREGRASRERWFAAVQAGGGAGSGPEAERAAAEADWEAARWRRAREEARLPAQRAESERAREEFRAGRRDRLQIEALLQAAAAAGRERDERLAQGALDDWHRFRSRRREPGREGGPAPGPGPSPGPSPAPGPGAGRRF